MRQRPPLLAAAMAALWSLTAAAGHAQVVENPCAGAPVRPRAVSDYLAATLIFRNTRAPALLPEVLAYRAALDKAKIEDWANLCQYRADDLRLAAGPAAGRRIVFIGDSITELWGLADPAFFSGGRVNRGISGQTTGQILLRFQADVVALHPRAVHILAGTNDLAGNTGPESMVDVHNNIAAMVALAKANGIRVYLASVPPARRFNWRPDLSPAAQVRELNTWLRAFAKAQRVTYVDYYSALTDTTGGLRAELSADGVHPDAAGYRLMAAAVPKD